MKCTFEVESEREGLGHALELVTLGLDQTLFSVILSQPVFWLSIVTFIVLLLVPKALVKARFLKTLTKGICIFQLYYSDHVGDERDPFRNSCIFIFFSTVVLWGVAQGIKRLVLVEIFPDWFSGGTEYPDQDIRTRSLLSLEEQEYEEPREPVSVETDLGWVPLSKFKVNSIYMDLKHAGLGRCILCFGGQMALILYYVYVMNGWNAADGGDYQDDVGYKTHHCQNVSPVKWFFALVIIELAGEDEVGADFNFAYWPMVMAKRNEIKFKDPGWFVPFTAQIAIRASLAFSINSVARAVILGTAPIMLSVEGPLDYIKDVMAVFFIIRLDDYGSDREYYLFGARKRSLNKSVLTVGTDLENQFAAPALVSELLLNTKKVPHAPMSYFQVEQQ